MLRTLPEAKRQGKTKNPKPGQATAESVASSWAYAVKLPSLRSALSRP